MTAPEGERAVRMPRRRLLQWWMVPGIITVLLLLYGSPWVRLYYPEFYRLKQWVFNLAFEMNFGVWSS